MLYEDSGCIHAVQSQFPLQWIGSSSQVHESKPSLNPAILWSVPIQSIRNNVKSVAAWQNNVP